MKYLFSITVEAESKAKAIAKFLDENINPADMDIEEVSEEKCFTVVGFYKETGQKYAGHSEAESADEAEKEITAQGVTVCGVFEGSHDAVDQDAIIK